MGWFGLGKRRTRLGKFIDEHGIKQQELIERSGVSRATIQRLCNDQSAAPNTKTASKIIKALRKFDSEISSDDFWG